MTMHVNIGEAKARLSQLVAAAMRGEDVVLDKAGAPQVRLVPIAETAEAAAHARAGRRHAALGVWEKDFEGWDTRLEALKSDRDDCEDARFRRKFGPPD